MKILATYLGHESSFTFYDNGKITTIELDKLVGDKWFSGQSIPAVEFADICEQAFDIIGTHEFDLWINGSWHNGDYNGHVWHTRFKNIIKAKRVIVGPGHHELHAWGSFYQSPFDKALTISTDGGGNDGVFNIYRCDKETGIHNFERIDRFDFGTIYGLIGALSREVDEKYHFLNVAGKAMGLAPFYKPNDPLTDKEKDVRTQVGLALSSKNMQPIYKKNKLPRETSNWNSNIRNKKSAITIKNNLDSRRYIYFLQNALNHKMNDIIVDRSYEVFSRYDGNVVLTGGVALNVTMNEFIKNESGLNVFVPCNPSDRGLSLGMIYWYLYMTGEKIPEGSQHLTGIPLIGDGPIDPSKRKTSIKTIAKMIKNGAIIGVAEGTNEIGQRALGRRSIICDPSVPGIKDKINSQIKHREMFRPFAPVVLEEHLDYFESWNKDNLEFMSFALKCTDEFKEKFPAVVHVDGTARVQVCKDENSTVYKLMKELGTPLLNTSFNIQGQPIIARESEAFEMLEQGGLDAILVHGVLYKKPKSDK